MRPDHDVVVKIRSDEGMYVNQTVVWYYYNKDHSIVLESDPPERNACFIADDDPPEEPFFTLSASHGEATNLVLRRLTVKSYVGRAILFEGDEQWPGGWNGFNAIEDCVFQDIGNARRPEGSIAYSVIGIVNSRCNRIANCRFIDIMNHTVATYPQTDQRPDNPILGIGDTDRRRGQRYGGSNPNIPIIAIYIAHHSDSNHVASCSFRRVKGDAIRIRDDSNGNRVSESIFELTGWHAVISTWHCGDSTEGCAEKLETERPSRGNVFEGNRVNGNWKGGKPALYRDLMAAGERAGSGGFGGVTVKDNSASPYIRRLVRKNREECENKR